MSSTPRNLSPASETPDSVAYFEKTAAGYSAWTASDANFQQRLQRFDSLIKESHQRSATDLALDLGCGNGELTLLAALAGFHVVAIDGSLEMLKHASGSLSSRGLEASFRHERLPLRAEVVDEFRGRAGLLVVSSVIEYLEEDDLFLSQCREMLASDGTALVSFANAASPRRRVERLLGPRGPLRGSIVEVQRRQHNARDVRRLAHQSGLRIEGLDYFGQVLPGLAGRAFHRGPSWLRPLLLVRFSSA